MDTGDFNMLESLLLPDAPAYFLPPPNQLEGGAGDALPGTRGSCMPPSESAASAASAGSCVDGSLSGGSEASGLWEEPVWRHSRMARCSSRLV